MLARLLRLHPSTYKRMLWVKAPDLKKAAKALGIGVSTLAAVSSNAYRSAEIPEGRLRTTASPLVAEE